MRMFAAASVVTLAFLATVLVACGSGDDLPSRTVAPVTSTAITIPATSGATPAPIRTEDVTVTPTPAGTPSPSPSPSPATGPGNETHPDYPVYDQSVRTGNNVADLLIDAVVQDDLRATMALVEYLRLPCVGVEKSAAPGVVRCRPGEAGGTIVSVLPVVFSDRTYLRADDVQAALRQLVKPGARVFAAYRVPVAEQGNPDWPGGAVGIVFVVGGRGILARVNDEGLVLLNLGAEAARNPYDLTNLYSDFLLAPKR